MKSFEGVDLREYENVGPLVGYVYMYSFFKVSSYSMQQWRSIAKKLKKINNQNGKKLETTMYYHSSRMKILIFTSCILKKLRSFLF